MQRVFRSITAAEYDSAMRHAPQNCLFLLLGDKRGGRELLDQTAMDMANPFLSLAARSPDSLGSNLLHIRSERLAKLLVREALAAANSGPPPHDAPRSARRNPPRACGGTPHTRG